MPQKFCERWFHLHPAAKKMSSLMPVLGGHSTGDSRDLPPEDALEKLLGQVYEYHVTEVQQLRDEIRILQSRARRPSGDEEDSDEAPKHSGDSSDLNSTSLDGDERRPRTDSDEGIEFSKNASIAKPWKDGKKRGLSKRNTVKRSTSALMWDGNFRHWLKSCIKKPVVDCTMSILILCNALVFAVEAQYRGFELADDLKLTTNGRATWLGVQDIFTVLELAFGITFTLEVALRWFAEGSSFFKEAWNWLDGMVISVWLLEKLVTNLPVNSQILRLARLFRLLRLLRLVRRIQEFDALFLMTTAIRSSVTVLGWTMALLFICQLLFALVVQQILFGFYFDPNAANQEAQLRVYEYFGTFTRSLLSLFELTLANWPPVCRLLVEEVSEWWLLMCLLHKLTMGFAVIGVINAVLMQETFKVAYLDDTVMVREKMRTMRAHVAKMSELFHEADTSGDGKLDFEEFTQILKKHEVKVWLSAMELDVSNLQELFTMLDTGGDGRLSADELLRSMILGIV
eukprot:s881_g5.t1